MSSWGASIAAVARRPRLWPTAVGAYLAHVPGGWHRRAPFLPVPDRAWMGFRLQTQYGDSSHVPEPDDLVAWLEWLRGWHALPR
jgi:hypothetical protein